MLNADLLLQYRRVPCMVFLGNTPCNTWGITDIPRRPPDSAWVESPWYGAVMFLTTCGSATRLG